jgi:GxxExxY protein
MEEMKARALNVKSQIAIPINYKSRLLGTPLRLDLLVNDTIIVEIKAVEVILPVHKAQLISYLKLSSKPKGLLINFHSENIKNNVISLVNEEFAKLPAK